MGVSHKESPSMKTRIDGSPCGTKSCHPCSCARPCTLMCDTALAQGTPSPANGAGQNGAHPACVRLRAMHRVGLCCTGQPCGARHGVVLARSTLKTNMIPRFRSRAGRELRLDRAPRTPRSADPPTPQYMRSYSLPPPSPRQTSP